MNLASLSTNEPIGYITQLDNGNMNIMLVQTPSIGPPQTLGNHKSPPFPPTARARHNRVAKHNENEMGRYCIVILNIKRDIALFCGVVY